MSTIVLQPPSASTPTPTPTLQRLNSRGMLRSQRGDEDAQAIESKAAQQHGSHTESDHATHWLAPPLAPKVLAPLRRSKAADVAAQLHRIEYIEVSDVVQHDDDSKNYYVVNVYLKHERSRIPTNQLRYQTVLQDGDRHPPRAQAPDFTVQRRFSEFEKLRKDIQATVQHAHRHYCTFCDNYMYLLLFSSAQPGVLAKTVLRSTEVRAKLLNKFLHNVIKQFQQNRPRCRIACYSLDHLPQVLRCFLFGATDEDDDDHENEEEQESEGRRSDVSVASSANPAESP